MHDRLDKTRAKRDCVNFRNGTFWTICVAVRERFRYLATTFNESFQDR